MNTRTPRGWTHQPTRAQTTTWLTPLYILDALGPFDMDPCAHPDWPTAKRLVCLPEDGLETDWEGRIWCNPPYGRETWTWLDRLATHGQGTALVFARTETKGFINQVWNKATAVMFLHGRVKFHRGDGKLGTSNAGAPSVLVAYGQKDAAILRDSGLAGTFIRLSPTR